MEKHIEFLRYDATPGEKHLGVATIRYDRTFILRFKVTLGEKGNYYCQPPSLKVSKEGKDNYFPAFTLDSSYESDELKRFVLDNVEKVIGQTSNSVFHNPNQNPSGNYVNQGGYQQPTTQQYSPNYQQNTQQRQPSYQQQGFNYNQQPQQQQSQADDNMPF